MGLNGQKVPQQVPGWEEGGAGEGCSEEAASPSWQAVTAAQSSSVRKRLSAAVADLLGRPKAPRSFTNQRLLSATTY